MRQGYRGKRAGRQQRLPGGGRRRSRLLASRDGLSERTLEALRFELRLEIALDLPRFFSAAAEPHERL